MKVSFSAKQRPAPDVKKGIQVPYAPGRRNVLQWRWYLILTLVASPFIYLLYKICWPYIVLSAPGYISLHKTIVTSSVNGTVQQVWVKDGDVVSIGQPIAQIAAAHLDQRIGELREQIDSAPSSSPPLTPNHRSKESQINDILGLYRQLVDQALREVDFQQKRVDKVKLLFEQGAATVAEVNAVCAQFDAAQHTLTQARLDLATAQSSFQPTPPPASQQAKSEKTLKSKEELKQTLRQLEADREQYTPRAPQAGIVLEIAATKGKIMSAGEYLALIGRPEYPQVITYILPESASAVSVGRKATVILPGGPSLLAQVHEPPTQARRLPADLSSVIGTRDVMVIVTLDITDPFPADRAIENLPVDVRFHRFW
jgi:multidrug resistance efflux pump